MPATLIFDTETTGQIDFKAPIISQLQPHLLQLGAELLSNGKVIGSINLLVNPGGEIEIPESATKIHGITREMIDKYGIPTVVAIALFHNLAKLSSRLAGHNIDYDLGIMEISYYRVGRQQNFLELRKIKRVCTMKTTTNVLKLPGKYGFKWPTLSEAYELLVDKNGFQKAHSAMADVQACRQVLAVLEQRGVPLVGGSR